MNVTSTSKWTLGNIPITPEAGVAALAQFASTKIPQINSPSSIASIDAFKSALQSATASVRRIDVCPNIGGEQSGELNIIPFKEIPNLVQAGDIVSFVTLNDTPSWQSRDIPTIIKQRGWHAEIITPKQGSLIQQGQWYGQDVETPLGNAKQHPHYNDWPSYWNLHFFRFSPPKSEDNARFLSLMKGLEVWATVFPRSTWPSDATYNPVLFSDAATLMKLGDALVQKKGAPPNMVCIEWVHAVFCLACCYPLTNKFLNSRGTLASFTGNFPGVSLLDDSLQQFDTLPWAPYQPSYIVESFLNTYFDENPDDAVIRALPVVAGIPSPVIMPIAPLLELRRKSNPSNFNVSYVCTAVADEWCIPS